MATFPRVDAQAALGRNAAQRWQHVMDKLCRDLSVISGASSLDICHEKSSAQRGCRSLLRSYLRTKASILGQLRVCDSEKAMWPAFALAVQPPPDG